MRSSLSVWILLLEEIFSDIAFEISLWCTTKHFNYSGSVHVEDGNVLDLQVICSIYILKRNCFCLAVCYNTKYWKIAPLLLTAFISWKINDGMLKNPFWGHVSPLTGFFLSHRYVSCLPPKLTVTKMFSIYHLWQCLGFVWNKTSFL